MRRGPGEILPLLPPPPGTEPASRPAETILPGRIPPELEEVLSLATLNYIERVNNSRGRKIPLSAEGIRIAAGVIADAVELTGDETPIEMMTPKNLRRRIKDGLNLREAERRRGLTILDQLSQSSGPASELKISHDLGIPPQLVSRGKDQIYRYSTEPKPAALRQLAAAAEERLQVVPLAAREALVAAFELPHRRGDYYGLDRHLGLPHMAASAMVDRGEVAVRMTQDRQRPTEFDRKKPLGLEELRQLAGVLAEPEAETKILSVAAAAARELMGHQPEWIGPAQGAFEAFGRQMRSAAAKWRGGAAAEGTAEDILETVALTKIFEGLPMVPLISQIGWVTHPETITSGGVNLIGKRHLWERGLKLQIAPSGKQVILPNPATLVEAQIQLKSIGADPENSWRLKEAKRSLDKYQRVTGGHPDKIGAAKAKLAGLFPEFTDLIQLGPENYPVTQKELMEKLKLTGGSGISQAELEMILEAIDRHENYQGVSRQAAEIKRRIGRYQKALDNDEKWRELTASLDDADVIGDKQLTRQILTERQIEIESEVERLAARMQRQSIQLEWPNIGTAFYYWRTHPDAPPQHWQKAAIPASLAETDRQLELARQWRGGTGLFLTATNDGPRLIEFLESRLEILSAGRANISPKARKLMRAIKAAKAGGVDWSFANPLKTLVDKELNARAGRLARYRQTLAELEERQAEKEKVARVLAGFDSGEDETAAETLAGINSPVKRRGVGALIRLKLVPQEIREGSDKYTDQLTAAIRLMDLHRRTHTFTFGLPPAAGKIAATIAYQRNRDLATGRRATEWNEKEGAVTLPKRATAGDIQELLNILEGSLEKPNVFIPLIAAAGLTLGELMNAVTARVNVVLAKIEMPELIRQKQELDRQLETIRIEKEHQEALVKAKGLTARIKMLEKELAGAEPRLISEMKRLNLVLEEP